jgi:hypothetical protein
MGCNSYCTAPVRLLSSAREMESEAWRWIERAQGVPSRAEQMRGNAHELRSSEAR